MIALYMILNAGFMQVRFPPVEGGGIPIGELVLGLFLLFADRSRLVAGIIRARLFLPLLIFAGLGVSRALFATGEFGMWALRDATNAIESLYLLVGFAYADSSASADHLFSWLRVVLVTAVLYAVTFPFAEQLMPLSPAMVAGNGIEVPILFNYQDVPVLVILASAYIWLFRSDFKSPLARRLSIVAVVLLWSFDIAIFQSRTIYLQILAVLGILALYDRRNAIIAVQALTGVLLVIALIPLLGIDLTGRLGESISLDFVTKHFLAIGGVDSDTDSGGVAGAAAGVGLRLAWWMSIYNRLTSGLSELLFGLGYGSALTDFYDDRGALVREVHNSVISTIARAGLVGLGAWVWLHGALLTCWLKWFRRMRVRRNVPGQKRALILIVYFVMIFVNAMGEDALEKPFFAIPYYFLWGVVTRYSLDGNA